jgi:3-methylfumaryl-CoA hydratase
MSNDLDHLREWIGRTEEVADVVTPYPLAAMSATLDRDDAEPWEGDATPPGWHWLFFLPVARHSMLGPDGHPKRGGFLPPVPLPRRMWAGSRLEFKKPLRVGEAIRRVSEIVDVTPKQGKTGSLVFVLVRHRILRSDGLAVIDEHDLVYREAADPNAPPPPAKPAPAEAVWQRTITPDPVLLFRYSALTFNGHRIHYDRKYVTEEEGYPGLVVHGPLIATLLLDLCRRERPDATLSSFAFKAVRPTFDDRPFTVAGAPGADGTSATLWALDADGALTMTATAGFAG